MIKFEMNEEMQEILHDYANMGDPEFYKKYIAWRKDDEIREFIYEFPRFLGSISYKKEDYK